MSVRETSKKAYKEINADGTKISQHDVILMTLNTHQSKYKHYGMSLREISWMSHIDINAVSGRVNELKKSNKVYEVNKRKCTMSGRTVTPVSSINDDEFKLFNNPDDGSWKGR